MLAKLALAALFVSLGSAFAAGPESGADDKREGFYVTVDPADKFYQFGDVLEIEVLFVKEDGNGATRMDVVKSGESKFVPFSRDEYILDIVYSSPKYGYTQSFPGSEVTDDVFRREGFVFEKHFYLKQIAYGKGKQVRSYSGYVAKGQKPDAGPAPRAWPGR